MNLGRRNAPPAKRRQPQLTKRSVSRNEVVIGATVHVRPGLPPSHLLVSGKAIRDVAIAQRVGRFEAANHGTLFLDEIGDIPLNLQPKLLRVLQEQEFERLGSARTIRVDVRVIAATNRDLSKLVEEQIFRMDLFYRIHVFPINLPLCGNGVKISPVWRGILPTKRRRECKGRFERFPPKRFRQ